MCVLVERPLVFWAGGGQGKSARFCIFCISSHQPNLCY